MTMRGCCKPRVGLSINLSDNDFRGRNKGRQCRIGKGRSDAMSNIITGSIAVAMALVFLLFYAIRLQSVVLWIIIVGGLVLLVYDLYKSIKEGEDPIY